MTQPPRAGWHFGNITWTREGDSVIGVPRAARRAAGERGAARHRYRLRRPDAEPPPATVYRVDAPGTLRRQARIPLWMARSEPWANLSSTDRARLLAFLSHADGAGMASVSRETTAREIARRANTVTRADKRLRAAGWLETRARRTSRTKRLPNQTRLLLPGGLRELEAEIRRRLAGEAPVRMEGLRDDDVYVGTDGVRRVRSALIFAWELEHPDVQAALRSPVAAQVWIALRALLAGGPRRLSRLEIAERAGLVEPEDLLYAHDLDVDQARAGRCDDARKRVSEAIVGLEALCLVRSDREPGSPSRYHLLLPRDCEPFVPGLGDLTPRAWSVEVAPATPTRPVVMESPRGAMCPTCARPAHYDRAIPRDGWFDFCCDEAHAGQRVPACPSCGAAVDGETVTFDPSTGAVVCGHCDAHGRATYTVAPPRRPGGRVVGEPPIVDGPPPARRVVRDEDAEAVVREYLQALPPGARQRRRSPKVTAAELDAARVLVAQGGVEHAGWCARRLAAGAGAGAFFPADAAARVSSTA